MFIIGFINLKTYRVMGTIDENTVLQVGKFYNVRCAKIQPHGVKPEYVPVIGVVHQDKAFDFPHNHIHVDGRFIGKDGYFWVNSEGKTNNVVHVDRVKENDAFSYRFIEFVIKRRKCFRLTTGIRPPNYAIRYWTWYKSMIGKSCAGKRCPHYGTKMHEQDGKLVCPLHNLVGDIETEVIVSLPQVEIACGADEQTWKSFETGKL